jgi:hypothetical protein
MLLRIFETLVLPDGSDANTAVITNLLRKLVSGKFLSS